MTTEATPGLGWLGAWRRAWRTRHLLRELVHAVAATHPHLVIIRLHHRSDVDRFVTRLSAGVA